jgi:hypothetical protein
VHAFNGVEVEIKAEAGPIADLHFWTIAKRGASIAGLSRPRPHLELAFK